MNESMFVMIMVMILLGVLTMSLCAVMGGDGSEWIIFGVGAVMVFISCLVYYSPIGTNCDCCNDSRNQDKESECIFDSEQLEEILSEELDDISADTDESIIVVPIIINP